MMLEPGTVDLDDADEPQWLARCVSYIDRFIQSDLVATNEGVVDLERLRDMMQAVIDAKKRTH